MNMLNQNVSKEFRANSGQALGGMIGYAVLIVVTVALFPTIQNAITSAGLTGASAALAGLIVLVLVVVLLFVGLRMAGLA